MKSDKIRVEIVTPVHNRRDITLQCLRSLARLNTDGLEVGVIVVDDGSTDGTGAAIRQNFPAVKVIEGDGNLWFTEGTNVGVRIALENDPDYILMINDDSVFDQDFLRCLVETAEKNPQSIVGPLLLLWDTPHKIFQVAPVWDTSAGGWRHWYNQTVWTVPKNPWKVDLIVGNCVLVPAEALRKHGLMDSEKFPNFGDAEFTPRLRKKGWDLLIDPRARVFCQPNDLPKKVSGMTAREKFDALIVNLKHVHNIRRRFYGYYYGAPTKRKGILGFCMFFANLLVGRKPESVEVSLEELPLEHTFRDAQVKL